VQTYDGGTIATIDEVNVLSACVVRTTALRRHASLPFAVCKCIQPVSAKLAGLDAAAARAPVLEKCNRSPVLKTGTGYYLTTLISNNSFVLASKLAPALTVCHFRLRCSGGFVCSVFTLRCLPDAKESCRWWKLVNYVVTSEFSLAVFLWTVWKWCHPVILINQSAVVFESFWAGWRIWLKVASCSQLD